MRGSGAQGLRGSGIQGFRNLNSWLVSFVWAWISNTYQMLSLRGLLIIRGSNKIMNGTLKMPNNDQFINTIFLRLVCCPVMREK